MKQRIMTLSGILAILLGSLAIAGPMEREQLKEACAENLKVIGKALIAYRADHNGEMPDWLSELYPQYLQDPKILVCPADKSGGTPARYSAYKDPKMPSSYTYEFNPMQFIDREPEYFDRDLPKVLSFKEEKRRERKYFGNRVPMVRCGHHTPILDLSYDGKVYLSTQMWGFQPEAMEKLQPFLQQAMEKEPENWDGELSLEKVFYFFRNSDHLPNLSRLLEQDAALRLGSDDGVKVWLNGKPVWLIDAYRSVAMDQDTAVARLRKGRNRLLVKISQGTGDWGFYLRVTDAVGDPIPGVRFVPVTIHMKPTIH